MRAGVAARTTLERRVRRVARRRGASLSLWERAGVRGAYGHECLSLVTTPHPRSARPLPKGEAVPTASAGNAHVEAGVPRCSFGCRVPVLAVLELALAIFRPRDEEVVTWGAGLPFKGPESPGNVCAGVVDPRCLPGLAAVHADLDAANAAIAGECVAPNRNTSAGRERRAEITREECRANRDHEIRTPALLLVKALDVVVHQLDAGDPLDALFAK